MKKTWIKSEVENLFNTPLLSLLFQAQTVQRENFHTNEMELTALLSIKTGTCPEDCAYCPQSGHYQTGLQKEKLLDLDKVLEQAALAKKNGAMRFCMGAAWRNPTDKDLEKVIPLIQGVKALGLETCVTLGMLRKDQAEQLKAAGLDYYNHNLDTSPDFYKKIISTRTYQDRLDTLSHVRDVGLNVCCGGIIGMGETRDDRIALLIQLANLPSPPESVPINRLISIPGTPLADVEQIPNIEFIRTIAVARIMMPQAVIRLSAGRSAMSEEMQILCFMAGVGSFWLGDKLLTTENCDREDDIAFLEKLGMTGKKHVIHQTS
jgi:biotin synthase